MNATAAATVDQPVTIKNPAVLSKTGVNAWQQDIFGGYNLEPPDPSLCAGAGFVVQVVNSQVQISDGNLNHLTAPIPMEAFFGDFVNSLFDPLCSYNHSTGRFYMTEAVSDFATFSGVYIAVSTSSDPRGPWNIYFLDLGTFGGDGRAWRAARALPRRPAEPRLRPVHDLDLDEPVRPDRCGVRQRLLWRCVRPHRQGRAGARGTVPERRRIRHLDRPAISPDFDFGNCVTGFGACWYSIQPADTANGRYDTRSGGTQWALSALDFFGLSDNRIALWRFANTQSIGAFIPNISGSMAMLHYNGHAYTNPPLAPQPQNPTSPIQVNGNPLGDFLVLSGACPPGTAPAGCSNPGPIQTNDDRMRDTMMTTIGTCVPNHSSATRQMWGGLTSGGFGGQAGVVLFGVNLGGSSCTTSSLAASSLARVWTIHNPSTACTSRLSR